MPIPAAIRKQFYGRDWLEIIRPRILRRAGHKCEQCGKPNHGHVRVWSRPLLDDPARRTQFWKLVPGPCTRPKPAWTRTFDGARFPSGPFERIFRKETNHARTIKVVLTIAHLNHAYGDDRDENLKALCQWCHLNYDKEHHRETRRARKDSARPLLQLETTL
jgi:hypothetical protein